jgi:hypothetical protein
MSAGNILAGATSGQPNGNFFLTLWLIACRSAIKFARDDRIDQ